MSKRNLKGWTEYEVHPSADELAEVFWAMDAEEQAHFFHRLGEVSEGRLPMQLQGVADSPHITVKARVVMQSIGECGEIQ